MLAALRRQVRKRADPAKAKVLQGFFKTGEGEYGHGDVFLGLTVPVSRRIAADFRGLSFSDIGKLLKSKIHEERLIGLLLLVDTFEKGTARTIVTSDDTKTTTRSRLRLS